MYLKSLELHGFKSFAARTVLDFLPPKKDKQSVTAIVGPNGSGKSNIADAIRWVMGEQSLKQLRGKKSEDIIFGGSESKGKMGMASVTLTLDNRDHRADIDAEEVVLARRLYRSGESEYLVNGHTVRLFDLQILLAKAQFAHGSYSVIGQGMIDRLLLQSPPERKDFFDEATGIKEFQIKRHQAVLKLTRTKEHMAQAELLLNEVAPRLRTLSRQVKKLEERQEVELNLRELQEHYYATLCHHNQTQIDALHQELAEVESTYSATHQKLLALQTELAALAREASRQEVFAALQKRLQDAMKDMHGLERDQAVLQGRLQVEYAKVGKQHLGWLTGKIEELRTEAAKVDEDLKRAEELMDQEGGALLEQKERINAASIRRTELRGKIAELQHQTFQMKSEQAVMQFTGLRAVQAILDERRQFGDVYGAVAHLGRVDERYQLAMDVAAGSHIASVVVGNDKVASACIEFLRNGQLGVATFLPLNKIKPRFLSQDVNELLQRPGVHGLASDLVSYDKKFTDVFSYIFGNTLVVADLNAAREIGIGRARMVTLAGDLLETSGSMRGGYRRKGREGLSFGSIGDGHHVNVEEQEQRLLQLQNELAEAERAYEGAQERLTELQSRTHIAGSRADELGRRKQDLDREVASLSQEFALATMNPEEYDAAMKKVKSEQDSVHASIREQQRVVAGIQKDMDEFQAEEERKKQRVFVLQEEMQQLQQALNMIVAEKNQKEIALAKLDTKQEDLAGEVWQDMHASIESIVARGLEALAAELLPDVQANIQKLKYTLSLIGGIDEEVVKEHAETKERHDGLVAQLDDLNKATADLEEMVVELDDIMKKKRDVAFREIRQQFARYFELLFDGGKAELIEVYGEETNEGIEELKNSGIDNEIEPGGESENEEISQTQKKRKEILVGIDVTANPPGKKIKNIQALSGGERTMTSIALVCAILHTNPSPFVVLDEVEAALDEANTLRFTKILHELSERSQFIVITHNRATMHAADALYGVTMGGGGVSELLSVKLGQNS